MMHFDFTLGQLSIALAIIGGFWHMSNKLSIYKFQHIAMWRDFCKRHNLDPALFVPLVKEKKQEG